MAACDGGAPPGGESGFDKADYHTLAPPGASGASVTIRLPKPRACNPNATFGGYTAGMRIGPFGPSEFGVLLLTTLPWVALLALVVVIVGLLRRSARAQERIADSLERERRGA